MKRIGYLWLFAFYLFVITSNVGATETLTLQQAINLSIKHHPEVKISQKQTELEGILKLESLTNFLPSISASYRDGTRKRKIGTTEDRLSEDTKSITLNQPLVAGFSSIAKVRQAKYSYKSSQEKLNQTKNKIAIKVIENYLGSFYLNQILNLERQNIKLLKRSLALAKQSLNLQDIDYSTFTKTHTRKIKADLRFNENQGKLQKYNTELQSLITGRGTNNINTNNINNLIKPKIHPLANLNDLQTQARQHNPEVKSQSLDIQAKSSKVLAESGNLLPKVSLLLQYEEQKASQYFNGDNVINKVIYLDVQIPIFQSGEEYTSIFKAKKEKQIAKLQKKFILQDIKTNLNLEYQNFNSMKQSLKSLYSIIKILEKSLILSKDRLKKQDISELDVLLQESELIDIKIQSLNIELSKLMSYFKIKEIINDIL